MREKQLGHYSPRKQSNKYREIKQWLLVQYFPNLLKNSCKFGQTNFKFWKRYLHVNTSIGECRKSSFKPLSSLQVFKKPGKDSIFCLYCKFVLKNFANLAKLVKQNFKLSLKINNRDLCNNTCQTGKMSWCGFLSCYQVFGEYQIVQC